MPRSGSTSQALRLLGALSLALALFCTAFQLLGTTAARADTACSPGAGNCAPSNVQVLQQGYYQSLYQPENTVFNPTPVCGIEGEDAPLLSAEIDASYDDPAKLGSGTTEGNYPDSEAFQFTTADGTGLESADTVTISVPHPAESYPGAGSILPPAQVPTQAPAEQSQGTVTSQGPAAGGGTLILVTLPFADSGDEVQLSAYSPANPPPPGALSTLPTTDAVISAYNPITQTVDTGENEEAAIAPDGDPGIDAYFVVTDTASEDVVVAGTDVTTNVTIAQTATITFGTPSGNANTECGPDQESAPADPTPGDGYTYLLFAPLPTPLRIPGDEIGTISSVGYVVPDVTVSNASGVETATLTVPPGLDIPADTQVTVLVLDATSPPGGGTPGNPLSAPDTPYPPDDFSVSTTEDPVPGYPSTAPVLQADASGLSDYPVSDSSTYPVDGFTSTLTTSAATEQVGTGTALTATATLNDAFNNPVNDTQVSIFQAGSGTHADIVPQTVPTSSEYPETGSNGQVGYDISDECAETVNLEAVDTTDNTPVYAPSSAPDNPAPLDVPVTFTAGPPVAPDGTTTPAQCTAAPVTSQLTVSVGNAPPVSAATASLPADGTTPAVVNVTLGDQFGNADACQQVVLSPSSQTSHASVIPELPANPVAASVACPDGDQPGYTGADGVATFEVTDSTAEQVVLGVADTTVAAAWPSNAATDPEDVAQLNFEPGDATQSSVVASSASAPADGQPSDTVTVTLNDAAGQPLQGRNVTLAACTAAPSAGQPCTPDSTAVIAPSAEQTNSNGQATFDVADSSTNLPHVVYFQAADPADGVTIAQTAEVTFTIGGASLGASNPTVVADGTGTSGITFTLLDTSGNPVPGIPVSLTTSQPGVSIGPSAQSATGADGTAAFTVSGTQAGAATFTATATYPLSSGQQCLGIAVGASCTVTASTKVTFISAPQTFTVSATPSTNVPADGATAARVTVTALDAAGAPIAGLPVALGATGSAGGAPDVVPSVAVTGSNGQATFSVTDTTPETVTLSAQYQEIGSQPGQSFPAAGCAPACTATVAFVPTEAQASTVVASPSSAPADGQSAVTVTVTLLNGQLVNGQPEPISGHAVVLSTGSATTTVTPSNIGGLTNSSGQVSFTVTDTKPETLSVYARDENTGAIIDDFPVITFVPTEAQASTITVSPASLPADGPPGAPSTATVTVTLNGANCTQSPSGHTIELAADSDTAVLSGAAVSNDSGVATFTVSDPQPESVVLYAFDSTCDIDLAQTATVTFTTSEAYESTVLASPVSTPAGGPGSVLTVTLLTAAGLPISGHTVTVPAVGHAVVTPLSYPGLGPGVTNAVGQAQFEVTDSTVETVTLAAYDGLTELDHVASVNFTATEANQSTITATQASPPAGGPATTVTVTLISGDGLPIGGDIVALTASSSTAVIAPTTVTTNAAGQAQFTVSDPDVQSVQLTAVDMTTGVTLAATPTLNFTANEQNQSTATASPATVKVKKSSTITVILLGANGQPLAGHAVTLATGSKTAKVTILTSGGVTTSAGEIQFSVTDTTAETLTITVTDTTTGVTLYKPVTVTFTKS